MRVMIRPSWRWGLLLLALLVVAACVPSVPVLTPQPTQPPPSPTPVPVSLRGTGGTLRLVNWQAPTNLNPQLTAALKDLEAARLVYEPLASYNRDGRLVPFLAATTPSLENGDLDPQGRWVIWRLKPEVFWSDGEPFTAEDVRFTYAYVSDPAVGAANVTDYALVSEVEILDPLAVKVHFREPTTAWAQPFVGLQGMILPEHIFAAYKNREAFTAPANTQPVGTGPYRVVGGIRPQEVLLLGNELVETNKIIFEPNPYFREPDKPFFGRLELRGGGTAGAAASAVIREGLADYAPALSLGAEELTALETGSTGELVANPVARMELLFLNFSDPNFVMPDGERSSLTTTHPIFGDQRVRKALTYAINRRAIVELLRPAGSATANLLTTPPDYVSPNTTVEFDPERAKALLEEAGWVDSDGDRIRDREGMPLQLVLKGSNTAIIQQIFDQIYLDLTAIGVDLRINPIDPSVYYSRNPNNPNTVFHFYADLQYISYTNVSPDPTAFMQHLTCDQIPQKANAWAAGLNPGRWCNPAYEQLFNEVQTTLDPVQRQAIFIAMNDLVIDDVALIPLAQNAQLNGVSTRLSGIDFTPWDASVWNIKDWR